MEHRLVVIVEVKEDHGSQHTLPEHRLSQYFRAKDLDGAVAACRNFIQKHNLTRMNWDGGHVFDGSRQIALIEFDGTVRKEGDEGFFSYF